MKRKTQDAEIAERKKFLDVYSEFDVWLRSMGFRLGNSEETSTPADYNYSHYDNYVDSLVGVECYIQETLNLSIRFLRDRNEHKFMFVGNMGSHSETYTIEEATKIILEDAKRIRDIKLAELKILENI